MQKHFSNHDYKYELFGTSFLSSSLSSTKRIPVLEILVAAGGAREQSSVSDGNTDRPAHAKNKPSVADAANIGGPDDSIDSKGALPTITNAPTTPSALGSTVSK